MCGIAGYYATKHSRLGLGVFKAILEQTQIRGRHASGISWLSGDSIKTVKEPIPIKELINKFDFDGKYAMISHARYSTSDLRFNQPIANGQLSIVHNGVITQEAYNKWQDHFGYDCETANDSELIFRAVENGEDPLKRFEASSMAVISLEGKLMKFYRNGNRPLWYAIFDGILFIASTEDILVRAFGQFNIEANPKICKAGYVYTYNGSGSTVENIVISKERQLYGLKCASNYRRVEND